MEPKIREFGSIFRAVGSGGLGFRFRVWGSGFGVAVDASSSFWNASCLGESYDETRPACPTQAAVLGRAEGAAAHTTPGKGGVGDAEGEPREQAQVSEA